MARTRAKITTSFGALLLTWAAAGCVTQPLVQQVDPGGRRIVLLLDASTSMRENDPDEAALAGAELALALVGTRDNVAVIPYARRAEVLLPLTKAGDTARRAGLRQRLAEVDRSGVTNFAAALGKAREVLEAGSSPPGSAIVLLTDGVPYRQARGQGLGSSSRTLDDEVADITARGWKIFAIAMGAEASSPFLSRMVGETGGAVIPAKNADALLTAFQEVATEALGYLRAERGAEAVPVGPHTRRLAFLGRWDGQGEIAAPTREGQPVDPRRLITLPAQGSAPFAVTLIESPEPGRWQAERPGASEAVTLIEPSFGVDFVAGKPPAEVQAGQTFLVEVELAGDPAVVAGLNTGLRLRAQLNLEGQAEGAWKSVEGGAGGRFGLELQAPRVDADTPASVVVEAQVGDGAKPFVLRRSRALAVRAPRTDDEPVAPAVERPPLNVSLSTTRVELAAWADDPLPSTVQVTVEGDPERAIVLRGGARDVELGAGERVLLDLPAPPGGGAITLRAESAEARPAELRVDVVVRRFRLRGPAKVEPAPLPAGFTQQTELGFAVEPAAELRYQLGEFRGSGGARLEGTITDGVLTLAPGEDATPGRYRARLRIHVVDAQGLQPVDRLIDLRLLPPWSPPAAIELSGDWGWASLPVVVSLPVTDPVDIAIELEGLTWQRALDGGPAPAEPPVIDPELDMRWEPLDGWSGQALDFDAKRFALSVFLSSDLPGGVYGGSLRLVPAQGDPFTVPITLEVRR